MLLPFFDSLHKLANVFLFYLQIDLIVLLVLYDVVLLHLPVIKHHFFLEFTEDSVVCLLEVVNVFVIVRKLDFLSYYRKIRIGLHAAFWLLVPVLMLHTLSIACSSLH